MKLAELFIEFATKGAEGVQKAIGGIKDGLGSIAGNMLGVGKAALLAFGAVGSVAGVLSVMQNTAQGNRLMEMFDRLNMTVASVFLPMMELVMDILDDMFPIADKFLNAMQPAVQELADSFWMVWQAVKPLVEAAVEAEAEWLSTIVQIVSAITQLLLPVLKLVSEILLGWVHMMHATLGAFKEFVGLKQTDSSRPARKLSPTAGGFEALGAVYQRIAQASIRTGFGGKTTAERQLDVAEQQLNEAKDTNTRLGNLRPAFA